MGLTSKSLEDTKRAIVADIAEIDAAQTPAVPTPVVETMAVVGAVCDCTGGPGRDNKPGTGLIDDFTLCPKCQGTGKVRS